MQVYLVCAFGIGVPILMAEILIGRRGRRTPPGAMRTVALAEGGSPHWQWAGALNLVAAFLIGVGYVVIIGWVLLYLWLAVTTGFVGMDAAASQAAFDALQGDTVRMVAWTWVALALTGVIIDAGVQKGIERAVTWMMPALFGLLVVLAIYNVFSGGFRPALAYLFSADFSRITASVWLAAVGQAFFSIGVGMAGMMLYGAYLPRQVHIPSSVWLIIVADTGAAMLSGIVIFPVVFAVGLDPAGGPGLIFQTLPVAFARMPGGWLFGVLFFLTLSFAAITSMVGLTEASTAWLEEHYGLPRHTSAVAALVATGALSALTALGYAHPDVWRVAGLGLNDLVDRFANELLLPLGGFLIAVFAGWQMSRASARDELAMTSDRWFDLWRMFIRYPVPAAVLIILVMGMVG